jgi:hypothetical protein
MVSNVFQMLLQVFQMHVSSVSSVFKRAWQMLHLNVPEVDRMLHLPHRLLLPYLGVSSSSQHRLGIRRLLSLSLLVLVTFGVAWALHGRVKRREKMIAGIGVHTLVRPDVRALANLRPYLVLGV